METCPATFKVQLMEGHPNSMASIYRSKAVGEPPFMLGMSVWCALRDALASLTDYRHAVRLDTPATPERVMQAARKARHIAASTALRTAQASPGAPSGDTSP